MLRRLIILLLIVGCDNFFQDEGICVLKYTETNSYNCYPQTTESQCIADSEKNNSIIIRYWGENYNCNEFCAEETTSSDTCIVN